MLRTKCVAVFKYENDRKQVLFKRLPDHLQPANPEMAGFATLKGQIALEAGNWVPEEILLQGIRQQLDRNPACTLTEYVLVSINFKEDESGHRRAGAILKNGIDLPDLGHWQCYQYWRQDEELAMVMVKQLPFGATFTATGMLARFERIEKAPSLSKYIKRVMAHHNVGFTYGEVATHDRRSKEFEVDFEHCRMTFRHRVNAKHKKTGGLVDDGALQMGVASAQQLFKDKGIRVGDCAQVTILGPEGISMFKGHMLVVDEGEVAASFAGAKSMLCSTGKHFSIGILNWIHKADRFVTDFQTIRNMRMDDDLLDFARPQYARYRKDLESTDALARRCVRTVEDNPSMFWEDDGYLVTALLRANEEHDLGINLALMPPVIRRAGALWQKQMDRTCMQDGWTGFGWKQGTGKLQIEIPEDIAVARYVQLDPTCYDSKFRVVGCGVLKKGQAYCGGRVGTAFVHRQPNAEGEFFELEMVNAPELDAYKESPCILVSYDTIAEMLTILGGGDQDDRLAVWFGAKQVAHFRTLKRRQLASEVVEALLEGQKEELEDLIGEWQSSEKYEFTKQVMSRILSAAAKENLTLGSVVLALILNTHLKDEGLHEGVHDIDFLGEKLEDIIDALVKDGSDVSWVKEPLDKFWVSLKGKQVPMWVKRKFTDERLKDMELQFVETKFDKTVRTLKHWSSRWQDWVNMRQHAVVLKEWDTFVVNQRMSSHVFARGSEAWQLANAISLAYRKMMLVYRLELVDRRYKLSAEEWSKLTSYTAAQAYAQENVEFARAWKYADPDHKAYNHAQEYVWRMFGKRRVVKEAFVILWNRVYDPTNMKQFAQGEATQGVSDGLLWGTHTTRLTIDAMIWARKTYPDLPTTNDQDGPGIVPVSEPVVNCQEVSVEQLQELGRMDSQVDVPFFTVVNGWHQEGYSVSDMDVRLWKANLVDKVVKLTPCEYKGAPAVKVYVGSTFKAWIDRHQAANLCELLNGRSVEAIVMDNSPFTLRAYIM